MGAGRGRRTGIILILLIIVVLIGAIAALFLVPCLLPGSCPPATGDTGGTTGGNGEEITPPPTQVTTLQVIVAARDIPRGARLSVQDVTILQWPIMADSPPPLGILLVEEGGAGLDQVEGRLARTDILNGQPVLDFMLTPGEEPTSLTDVGSTAALLIPSGQVAVAMPINRLSSVAYAIREGDHVDLMMSVRFVDVDEEFQTILPNSGTIYVDNPDLLILGIQGQTGIIGRAEPGYFPGSTIIVGPNPEDLPQRPRQSTQIMIDNAIVLRVGNWPLVGLYEPIVVTPNPPPTPVPEGEESSAPPPPTATPVVIPDVVTLTMSRQDALVLKYMLETGADIDMVLRSALDDDVNDTVSDTVTLSYIIDFYNLTVPPTLPFAQQPRIDLTEELGGGGVSLPGENPDATPVPAQP